MDAEEKRLRNLRPCTSENARERQKKGVAVKKFNARMRKFLSEVYADILARKFSVEEGGEKTGEEIIVDMIIKIIMRGDGASVSMIREMREAMEGRKIDLVGTISSKMESTEERIKAFEKLMGDGKKLVDNPNNKI